MVIRFGIAAAGGRRGSGVGQEDQFPRPSPSGRCRLSQATFAAIHGNVRDAPFSAIPVTDHLPPSRVLRIAGTAAKRCGSQINDGSKSDVDLR